MDKLFASIIAGFAVGAGVGIMEASIMSGLGLGLISAGIIFGFAAILSFD